MTTSGLVFSKLYKIRKSKLANTITRNSFIALHGGWDKAMVDFKFSNLIRLIDRSP